MAFWDILNGLHGSSKSWLKLTIRRYDPIQKFGPQDCVARINDIVTNIDALIAANNTAALEQLKQLFGLSELDYLLDFVYTVSLPVGGPLNYPLGTWQELNWNQSYSDPHWWWFCGNVSDNSQPANVTAGDSLLANYTNGQDWTGLGAYANYFQQNYLPLCTSGRYGSTDPGCYGTQNRETRLFIVLNHQHLLTWWQNPTGMIRQIVLVDRTSTHVRIPSALTFNALTPPPKHARSWVHTRPHPLKASRPSFPVPSQSITHSNGAIGRFPPDNTTRSLRTDRTLHTPTNTAI